jgi:Rrf2 family protein
MKGSTRATSAPGNVSGMLNKSSLYGLYALVTMTSEPERKVSAKEIAGRFGISESHVAKVLQQLARARIVSSTRGVGGGFELARDPKELTMLDVVEQLEGPRPDHCDDCAVRHAGGCTPDLAACAIHNVLGEIETQAYYTLKSVTLATLARRGQRLIAIEDAG